ncbi:MAG: hypothetical protein ACREV6_21540 [Clostridium sp.]|uniref:hypothetical protein n=1 Tax=Clostridium sp. TaxID=1506 RepID=UPI003D6CD2A2
MLLADDQLILHKISSSSLKLPLSPKTFPASVTIKAVKDTSIFLSISCVTITAPFEELRDVLPPNL